VHAAPPVRVTLGRSHGWTGFTAVVGGAAAANIMLWFGLRAQLPAALWLALAAGLSGALAAAAVVWRGQAPGVLGWDGQRWQWAGREGDARVSIDLNGWMLLRLSARPSGGCWIAASRRRAQGDWPALRAALYSRRPADLPSDAPPA
jgi:hypothetical protein